MSLMGLPNLLARTEDAISGGEFVGDVSDPKVSWFFFETVVCGIKQFFFKRENIRYVAACELKKESGFFKELKKNPVWET